MSEASGTLNAECIQKLRTCPEIKVGTRYEVHWKRSGPGSVDYTVILPNSTHTIKDGSFMTHFKEV